MTTPSVSMFAVCVGGFDPSWAENYGSRVGETLTLIGNAYSEHLTLLRGPSGKFYGGYDQFLCYLGSSPEELIDNLLDQRTVRIE